MTEQRDPAFVMQQLRAEVLGQNAAADSEELVDAAALLDQTELMLERQITSHRPVFGRFYVMLRRWIFREIRLSLSPLLRQQSELNRMLVRRVIAQQEQIRSLEAKVRSARKPNDGDRSEC